MSDAIMQWFESESAETPPKEQLAALTEAMRQLAETYEPALTHYRAKGLYGRRIYVPAGTCVTTLIHKQEHFTIALKGRCLVVNEQGVRAMVEAPAVFVTQPGTQRACYAVTDVEWLTVHAVDQVKNVRKMADVLCCESFAEYDYQQMLLEEGLTESDAKRITGNSGLPDIWPEGYDPIIEIAPSSFGMGAYVTRPCKAGEDLGPLWTPAGRTPLGHYANHSHEPNARVEPRDGGYFAVAAQDLPVGVEVTLNYRHVLAAIRAEGQI